MQLNKSKFRFYHIYYVFVLFDIELFHHIFDKLGNLIILLFHPQIAEMNKKRKVDDEKHIFQERWTTDYFCIEFKNKIICLICRECIAVLKEYNIKGHYDTKHKSKYGNLSIVL